MKFTDKVVAKVLGIEVDLYQAYVRVIHESDTEALHDFRIALRRLRSLLNPLGMKATSARLNGAAAEVGRLTTPIRDMEVMAAELEAYGLSRAARTRRQAVSTAYRGLNGSPVVERLFEVLTEWPVTFRSVLADAHHESLKSHVAKRISQQLSRLSGALNDPGHDRHEIRLLVKRARYSQESFPERFPVPSELLSGLKQLQAALGDWHDRHQWCLRARQEIDLEPLVGEWAQAEIDALQTAEAVIASLADRLADFLSKKKPPEARRLGVVTHHRNECRKHAFP